MSYGTSRHFSREDTEFFKGLGILTIVLHNYFHWVAPSPGENEFDFSREKIAKLFEGLTAQPLEAINLLFSYFGHYGVQVFVFLSAYGLARAYGDSTLRWGTFMVNRFTKIYVTFLIAVMAHALFVAPWDHGFIWTLKAYLLRLSLLANIWPGMQLSLVGPWWFFSFIFQFYAVFPMLNWLVRKHGDSALVVTGALGLGLTVALNPVLTRYDLNLYFTVIGHLPVLCLGIYVGRRGVPRFTVGTLFALGGLFIAGNWFEPLWYVAPICVTLLVVTGLRSIRERSTNWPKVNSIVLYCGAISLPLFAIHGMMRLPFTRPANDFGEWYITIALGIVFLLASLLAAQVVHWTEAIARASARRGIAAMRAESR